MAGAEARLSFGKDFDRDGPPMVSESARQLSAMSEEFVELACRLDPVGATLMGIHDYDDRLPDDSPDGFAEREEWLRGLDARLTARVVDAELTSAQRVDATLLRSRVASLRYQYESLPVLTRNPVRFSETAMQSIFLLMERPFAPLDERKEVLLARLLAIPAYLERATHSLTSVPAVFAETARDVNLTGPSYVDEVARALIRHFPGEGERIEHAASRARVGFSRYQEFLERELPLREGGSLAIGEPALEELLRREHLITRSAREIETLGRDHVAATRRLLEEEAKKLDPALDWREQVTAAKKRHPEASRVRELYTREVERARKFVLDRRIAPIPDGPLQVIDTPPFERVFVPYASYLPPGPFDADQTGVFYVTPIDLSRSRAEQLEQLEGHCSASIPLVVLHETYPGHHLQRLQANLASSRLRQLAADACFVDGWALYCEEMMWEQGFFMDPATRLIQLRDLLFRACRAVIDVRLQCGTMTPDEAVEYLVQEALIEPVNARREVRRYVLAPTQPLSFLVGKLELQALRNEAQAQAGERFNLQEFHAGLLAGGALPIALVREELRERVKTA